MTQIMCVARKKMVTISITHSATHNDHEKCKIIFACAGNILFKNLKDKSDDVIMVMSGGIFSFDL